MSLFYFAVCPFPFLKTATLLWTVCFCFETNLNLEDIMHFVCLSVSLFENCFASIHSLSLFWNKPKLRYYTFCLFVRFLYLSIDTLLWTVCFCFETNLNWKVFDTLLRIRTPYYYFGVMSCWTVLRCGLHKYKSPTERAREIQRKRERVVRWRNNTQRNINQKKGIRFLNILHKIW